MTAWKTLREEMHWRQPSSPMEWAHQPLLWNPNITNVSDKMFGIDVGLPWVGFEKQWWPTVAKWWEHQQEIGNIMETANKKWKKMITLIKNSMWMYPWEAHVVERGFEGCKWLGRFNARWIIWMPIRVFTRSKKEWEKVDIDRCKNNADSKI